MGRRWKQKKIVNEGNNKSIKVTWFVSFCYHVVVSWACLYLLVQIHPAAPWIKIDQPAIFTNTSSWMAKMPKQSAKDLGSHCEILLRAHVWLNITRANATKHQVWSTVINPMCWAGLALSSVLYTKDICWWSYLPNPSARAGYDTRSIFKRSLTGLGSEFSFS